MAETLEQIEKFVGRIYTHFIYRDLIYIGGGILILAIPFKVHWALLEPTKQTWWLIVAAALAAYALGFFAQEFGVIIGLVRMYPPGNFVEKEVNYIYQRQRIASKSKEGEEALLGLERIILIKHMSAVLGSSSLITLVILLLYYITHRLTLSCFSCVFASVILVAVVIVMVVRNWRAADVQQKLIEKWSEDLTS